MRNFPQVFTKVFYYVFYVLNILQLSYRKSFGKVSSGVRKKSQNSIVGRDFG
jgi:hypothetical protein